MWAIVLATLIVWLASKVAVAAPQVTIWGISLEDQGTTQILSASAIYSPVNVFNSITNYQVIEVDSLLIVEGTATTQTILTTPITQTYTVQRAGNVIGNTIVQTVTPTPGMVIVESGVAACGPAGSATVFTAGIEAQCIEILTESGNGVEIATTFGYNGIVHVGAVISDPGAISTIDTGSSTTLESSSPPTSAPASSPTPVAPAAPISQVTVFPTQASNTTKSVSVSQLSLMVITVLSMGFFDF